MQITIKNWLVVKNACIEGEGVHFVAGPGSSGKTSIKNAIVWALTGRKSLVPPQGASVTVLAGGLSLRRSMSTQGETLESFAGKESISAERAISAIGFKDASGVDALYADLLSAVTCVKAITREVMLIDGKEVNFRSLDAEQCKRAYSALLVEKESLVLLSKGIEERKTCLIENIAAAEAELETLRTQRYALREFGDESTLLYFMSSKECPLWNRPCPVNDEVCLTMTSEKCEKVERLKSVVPNDPVVEEKASKKEREIVSLKERLNLLNEASVVGRMKEVNDRLVKGRAVLDAIAGFGKCGTAVDKYLLKKRAGILGLDVDFSGGALSINGKTPSLCSREERLYASFAIQEALCLPIIVCDDVDTLSASSRGRLVKHAVESRPARFVLFLGASSERPRAAPGLSCWFLKDGALERVAGIGEKVEAA